MKGYRFFQLTDMVGRSITVTYMLEPDAYSLLAANGLAIPEYRMARSAPEAVSLAEAMGFPVAMKIVSEDVIHKSDVGGVRLNLEDSDSVEAAYEEIMGNVEQAVPGGRHKGVLLTQMVKGGTETILGIGMDGELGKFLMFGLGGVYAELFKDVSFRLAPLSRQDAWDMIDEVKSSVLLRGFRGEKPKDLEALVNTLLACSQLAVAHPEIEEMDLNPVMVREEGAYVLDARIMHR
jgi:acetyltransferase